MTDTAIQNKEQIVKQIYDSVSAKSVPEQVEILANIFILLGFDQLPGEFPETIEPSNLMKVVIKSKSTHGETIGSALVEQGMTLLMWIDSIK